MSIRNKKDQLQPSLLSWTGIMTIIKYVTECLYTVPSIRVDIRPQQQIRHDGTLINRMILQQAE